MDLKDYLIQIADRITKTTDSILTEEATKMSFILPLISALGYDVYNPLEVVPEMDCDLIKKKGEKIDYAIMKNGHPILLIECKHCKQNLNLHDTQLQKYFVASNARFGILTNGIEYRFYTDTEKANVMDEKPFLVINMLDLPDKDIEQLKKFHKSHYDETNILSSANELKYTTSVKSILLSEFSDPSVDFVKLIARKAYDGQITQKIIDQFTPFIKNSINSIVSDMITERLSRASKNEPQTESKKETDLPDGAVCQSEDGKVVTTQEELDAYNIIRSILRKDIDVSRVTYSDFQSYFLITIDGSSKWICRLYFKRRGKAIAFPYGGNSEERFQFEKLEDIFNYSDKLIESLNIIK